MGLTTGNVFWSFTQATTEDTTTSGASTDVTTTGEPITPISAVPEGITAISAVPEPAAEVSNPILPVGPELVWGAVTFFLLWALMKFVLLKPVQAGMEQRAEKIRADIDAADTAKAQAAQAVVDYEASLAVARAEATRIIEDGRAQGEAKRRELVAAAEAEVNAERTAANDRVAAAKAEAMVTLRSNVTTIAVGAAGAVVGKQLDVESNRSTVESFLAQN